MITILKGQLEIDHDRGVVYFHITDANQQKEHLQMTPLRIGGLNHPIPLIKDSMIDLHLNNVDTVNDVKRL